MFLCWGKREILTTSHMQTYLTAKQRLKQAGIPHHCKMANSSMRNWGNHFIPLGTNAEHDIQYQIFVPKSRVDEALYCIRRGDQTDRFG